MNYFISDIHFNNEDTLILDNRPFKSTKEFDNMMIKQINKQASKYDTLYVIGDFIDCDGENSNGWKKAIEYVKRINTNVVLIMGNNEDRVVKYFFNNDFESFRKYCLDLGFKEVYKDYVININDYTFYLIHKPKHCKKEMLNLFGHIHRAGGIYAPFGFNIGCDLNHFKLYSENDIMHLLDMKGKYWDKDNNLKAYSLTLDNE